MRIKYLNNFIFFTMFSFLLNSAATAQVSWKRSGEQSNLPLQLFHSTHSIILPTTETLQHGDIEFEVSHRFLPAVSEGSKEFFGFDGPANIKLSLSYGITDELLGGLTRSNVNDNLEIFLKYRLIEFKSDFLPIAATLNAGAAWNTDPAGRTAGDNRNFQYYGQFVINTMFDNTLGIGIIPSFLYNSNIYCQCKKTSFTLGLNAQYYISSFLSILTEWNPTIAGHRNKYDSFGFGVELETGGHFFKIIFTNNPYLNTSQYLGGSDLDITPENLRIGFNITRLLTI